MSRTMKTTHTTLTTICVVHVVITWGSMNSNWRTPSNHQRNQYSETLVTNRGTITKCNICESVMHWAPKCPHQKNSDATYFSPSTPTAGAEDILLSLPAQLNQEEYEIVIHQSDHDTPQHMNSNFRIHWLCCT